MSNKRIGSGVNPHTGEQKTESTRKKPRACAGAGAGAGGVGNVPHQMGNTWKTDEKVDVAACIATVNSAEGHLFLGDQCFSSACEAMHMLLIELILEGDPGNKLFFYCRSTVTELINRIFNDPMYAIMDKTWGNFVLRFKRGMMEWKPNTKESKWAKNKCAYSEGTPQEYFGARIRPQFLVGNGADQKFDVAVGINALPHLKCIVDALDNALNLTSFMWQGNDIRQKLSSFSFLMSEFRPFAMAPSHPTLVGAMLSPVVSSIESEEWLTVLATLPPGVRNFAQKRSMIYAPPPQSTKHDVVTFPAKLVTRFWCKHPTVNLTAAHGFGSDRCIELDNTHNFCPSFSVVFNIPDHLRTEHGVAGKRAVLDANSKWFPADNFAVLELKIITTRINPSKHTHVEYFDTPSSSPEKGGGGGGGARASGASGAGGKAASGAPASRRSGGAGGSGGRQ